MEENRWAFKVFSADGRIGRLQFAYAFFLGALGAVLCFAGLVMSKLTFLVEAAFLVVSVVLIYAYTAAVIKRLHDLNRPGSDFFLTLIPVFNIYIFIKLFFFRSKPEADEYWEKQSKAHYWMVPVFMVLMPALIFGIGAGYQVLRGKPIIPVISHYYDKTNIYSIDLPSGVYISGTAKPTNEKLFSAYTQADFAKLSLTYGTARAYVKHEFNIDDENIEENARALIDYTYRIEDIGGRKFVHISYQIGPIWGITLLENHIIGIYDSKKYKIDIPFRIEGDLLSRYMMERSIQTLRVGKDAIP